MNRRQTESDQSLELDLGIEIVPVGDDTPSGDIFRPLDRLPGEMVDQKIEKLVRWFDYITIEGGLNGGYLVSVGDVPGVECATFHAALDSAMAMIEEGEL